MDNSLPIPGWVFASATIKIAAPIQAVFDFVCDAENDAKWNPKILHVKRITEGPIGIGTAFRHTIAYVGGQLEGEWEVVEYIPHVAFHGRSVRAAVPFTGGYRLASQDGFTIAHKYANFDLFAVLPPLVPKTMAELLISKQFDSAFRQLKTLLESQ